MIVTKEQIEERLNSNKNIIHRGFSSSETNSPRQPEFIKKIEAGLVIEGESQRDVAAAFGVDYRSINKVTQADPDVKQRLEAKRNNIRDSALDSLMNALGFINGEKLKDAKLTELSSVAKDMSVVVEKMSSKDSLGDRTLIVFAPVIKSERDYEVIELHPISSEG